MIAYNYPKYQSRPQVERIVVVPSKPQHVHQMVELMCAAYHVSPDETYTPDQFRSQIRIFPEGQFVAVDQETGRVVGLTVSMRMSYNPAQPLLENWVETTNYGWLTTHDPNGQWLYGVESAVHPDYQGRRIGGKLIEARWDLVRRLNLRGMVAGSIIMDYHQVADTITPEQYVREVVDGARFDNNLTKQLKKGFKVQNLIPDYCDDPRSRNWGVAIVWENPDYLPNPKIAGRVTPARSHAARVQPRPPVAAQPILRATGQ